MSTLDTIRQPLSGEMREFESLFDTTMSNIEGVLGQICQSIAERKGKMMRPMLVCLLAKEWARVERAGYYAALTLELIHNASLVHDDIVDESDKRRGRPSVRAIYGNKVAVLAGDYLLSSALEASSLSDNMQIVRNLAELGKQVSEGEIIQLSNTQHDDFSEETYYRVIRLKTASLFAAAASMGAISAHQDADTEGRMNRLGEIIGICFQIRDDIFAYYDNKVGKPTGNDMA